ncbi:hypothetical protein [Bifidobacterium castoris]|uniref:hypothetical protein n=1 Tax=Bifidobacterium castoris TaxID=2306972 RepID=UPI000F7F3BA0|nr:hypothetical protein [Bifidobacterium castoris]MDE5640512.1 hypothetical protein [Bifidobacterium castoris]
MAATQAAQKSKTSIIWTKHIVDFRQAMVDWRYFPEETARIPKRDANGIQKMDLARRRLRISVI